MSRAARVDAPRPRGDLLREAQTIPSAGRQRVPTVRSLPPRTSPRASHPSPCVERFGPGAPPQGVSQRSRRPRLFARMTSEPRGCTRASMRHPIDVPPGSPRLVDAARRTTVLLEDDRNVSGPGSGDQVSEGDDQPTRVGHRTELEEPDPGIHDKQCMHGFIQCQPHPRLRGFEVMRGQHPDARHPSSRLAGALSEQQPTASMALPAGDGRRTTRGRVLPPSSSRTRCPVHRPRAVASASEQGDHCAASALPTDEQREPATAWHRGRERSV